MGLEWGRRGAELSAKGGVTGVGMSSWGVSLHPLLLENPVLMDKAGKASHRPFGAPCGERSLSWQWWPLPGPTLALIALPAPTCLGATQQSAGAECSPLWSLRPQSAGRPPL